ncbi:MAG: YopX family protein [Cellulosilyticaceae bacterium]
MRAIKFRAWDAYRKEMAHSDDGNQEYGWFTNTEGCMICVKIEEENDVELSNIMQYTGLNDKIGTEIYEDDIVEVKYIAKDGQVIIKQNCKVVFKDQAFGVDDYGISKEFTPFRSFAPDFKFGIVGNVYENPEWGIEI